jgi:segregation and condensation protein B
MSDDLKNIIEAVLLVSDSTVSVARIQGLFNEDVRPEATQVLAAIERLSNDCEDRGIELRKIGSGYRYQTRDKYADYLRKLYAVKPPRMSRALLETLAIIAYRQPVSRGDIEDIRGVTVSTEIMQRLIEREWIKQLGVRDVPGRPGLFGTTAEFLSYFNLTSLKDLPALMDEREIEQIAGEMEMPVPPEVLAALNPGTESIPEDSAEDLQSQQVIANVSDQG